MRTSISLTALTTALLLGSAPAYAQLNLGVSLGGDNGVNVNAGVNAGVNVGGSNGLGVNADANVGGSGGLDVDANANVGGGSGLDADAAVGLGSPAATGPDTGPNGGTLIDIGTPAQGSLIDVGTGNGGGLQVDVLQGPAPTSTPSQPSRPVAGGVHLAALDGTARVDALVDLINGPDLADIDIDATVDDRLVSITPVSDLLGGSDLARITAAVDLGGTGRGQLLDALQGSVELTSILDNAGVDLDDVLAVQIDSDGSTNIVVLGGATELVADLGDLAEPSGGTGGSGTGPLDGLTGLQLADLDIDLLSDQQLAAIDLTLLPNESQRLEAVLRLLGNNPTSPGGMPGSGGSIAIVDLDVLLGDESLADVEATLGTGNGELADLNLSADILDALESAGISADAVVGVAVGANGQTRVLVDLGLGDSQVADVDIGVGGTTPGTTPPTGGTDNGGTGGGGNGGGTTAPGGNGTSGTGGGGTVGTGGGSPSTGGTDNGGTGNGGAGTGNGTPGNGGSSGSGSGSGEASGLDSGSPGNAGPGTGDEVGGDGLFASLGCDAGITALTTGTAPTPVAVRMATKLELVALTGCGQATGTGNAPMLGETLNANPALASALQSARIGIDDVVGATIRDGVVTVFIRQGNA